MDGMPTSVAERDSVIGQRIMLRLRELDRDRSWLARQLDRDLSTIHRWISGSRRVSDADLTRISLVLHRSVAWLRGEGDTVAA
jgi:hypothetical protein